MTRIQKIPFEGTKRGIKATAQRKMLFKECFEKKAAKKSMQKKKKKTNAHSCNTDTHWLDGKKIKNSNKEYELKFEQNVSEMDG